MTTLETLADDVASARRAYESALAETSRAWMDAVDFDEDDNGTDDDASRRECASDGFDAEAVRQSSAGVATCETRAACARALVDAMDAAIGVSEFEDEDATTEKLERAAVNARRAAEYFDVVVQTGSVSSSMDIEEERAAVERANETLRRYGERTCDGVRDATWKLFREKLRASGWPPSLRPTELKEFRWRLTSEDEDEADAAMKEMRFVRSFHVLRVTSETRARFAGELSFAYDDVALAFVEDLAEAIRVTFATNGSLSDPRKPERMFACAKELTQRTPALLRAELDRVVFVDEPKIAVSTTRHYLSLLIHAVCDVIRTHVCVACAESDDEPWWLHVADECRAFDEEMSKNPYSTKPETPRALDALVRHRAYADAWMECEREHALSRAAKAWSDGKNWTRNSGDDGDLEFKVPNIAEIVAVEFKNILESAVGLSRNDWRLYFVNVVAVPLLDAFLDVCESRTVGAKGLGSLVAATGSWRAGSEGAKVVSMTINAGVALARSLRNLADETFVLEFGGETVCETYAVKFEKFAARWIEALADAASAQFTDKVIGDAFIGSLHLEQYAIEDEELGHDAQRPNVSASGYMLAALGPLRDRVSDAQDALGSAAFNKCWRFIASKTARVIVERVACTALFSRTGVEQFKIDCAAHADVFAGASRRPASIRAKTKRLAECVTALSCDVTSAVDLLAALRSEGMKGLAVTNSSRATLGISELDDETLERVLARRLDVQSETKTLA